MINLETIDFPNCSEMHGQILSGSTYSKLTYINLPKITSLYNDGLFGFAVNYSFHGPISYMNFHNLLSAGYNFMAWANVTSDIIIDLTNCIDFNFIQQAMLASQISHYINHNVSSKEAYQKQSYVDYHLFD